MPEILRFEEINLFRNEVQILKDFSFSLNSGQSLAILGRNGAGKTTLINLLFGYLWPTSGKIFAFGEEYGTAPLSPLQEKIGFLQSSHQEHLTQRTLTVLEVLITGIHKTLGLYKDITTEEEKLALDLLKSLNLESKANLRYSHLSSGEKTQVLLLRAMGPGIELLVLDEPTAALDFTARYQFERALIKIKEERPLLTRILITHRIEEIPDDFDMVMLVGKGELFRFGKKSEILSKENLSELYELPLDVHFTNQRYFLSSL